MLFFLFSVKNIYLLTSIFTRRKNYIHENVEIPVFMDLRVLEVRDLEKHAFTRCLVGRPTKPHNYVKMFLRNLKV